MEQIYTTIQDLLNQQSYQKELQKAQQRFMFKPFAVQYKLIKDLCLFRYISHTISVFTAIFYLAELINSAINLYPLSFGIAGFFLLLWEFVKSIVLQSSYESFFQTQTLPYQLIAISIVCIAGSVYSSTQGAKEFYKAQSKIVENTDKQYKNEKDSIVTYFENKLINIEKDFDKSVATTGYKGRLNPYNETHKKIIDAYNQKKLNLEKEEKICLEELKVKYSQIKNDSKNAQSFNKEVFGVLSLINEFMIVLVSWFLVYYDYKTVQEASTLNSVQNHLNSSSFSSQNSHVPNDEQPPPVFNTPPSPTDTFEEDDKKQSFLSKYQHVVDKINAGYTDKEIIDATGVGRTTFYKIKKYLAD